MRAFSKVEKMIGLTGSVLVVISALGASAVWALDQRYWNISDQKQFEVRDLKREVKRAELLCQKTNDETECAFYQFLKQDLEALTQ
jgi:uncharacterized protein (DUF4213/DUF364 family)